MATTHFMYVTVRVPVSLPTGLSDEVIREFCREKRDDLLKTAVSWDNHTVVSPGAVAIMPQTDTN